MSSDNDNLGQGGDHGAISERQEVSNSDGQQPPAAGQQARPPQTSFWGIIKGLLVRFVIIYFISSLFRRGQTPNKSTSGSMPAPVPSSNLFENGSYMNLFVFVSENDEKPNFENDLVWSMHDLIYGDWTSGDNNDGIHQYELTFDISQRVQNNGSLWIHVFVCKGNRHPSPDHETYSQVYTIHKKKRLNRYKRRHYKKTHNLLTGETSTSQETLSKVAQNITEEIISHWHPNLTINIVDDHTPWVKGSVPHPLDEFVEFDPFSGHYYPVVYLNDYWNLMRDYKPINDTIERLSLHLTYQPLSLFRWQLYTAQAMRNKWSSMLGGNMMEESEDDQDTVKEAFLETSPYLLGLTVIVSITHSVFEFLAFKNDIQFWNNKKSLEGLSVRSVFFNVFQSLVVLLYVLDNDTNTIVKISIGIGLIIELWKIHKVVDINYNSGRILGIIPRISFSDKGSYVKSSTKEYDLVAFRYLSWVFFPLLVCYAIYSLIYLEHKGLYSWILSMLYGFLLTFGFIAMTPQLFINYKLKSVAHLPWRMLTYKFLNTFIDDIFAFVIKMPTLYRIGCFRDDIIFLIYVYQRWIYRVDYKRVNEFGVSGEDLDNKQQSTEDNGVLTIEDKKDK